MAASGKKRVLVTGCSTGSVGAGLAREFHSRGFAVIATARSLSRLQDLATLGIQIEELDVTSSRSIEALRSKVSSLDILFNNAGGLDMKMIADTSLENWKSMFDQNFFSVVQVTQAFLPLLVESKGIIVNHTSLTPYFAFPGMGMYGSSKAALRQYTDTLRTEMYPFSVRVVELMTGVAGSNIVLKQMPEDAAGIIPPGSLYWPIKDNVQVFTGATVAKSATDPDTHARNVVSDLLDGGGWLGLGGWLGMYWGAVWFVERKEKKENTQPELKQQAVWCLGAMESLGMGCRSIVLFQ
ncbi:NAD(P)-binding protein [Polyplosphaeria fusca]|uniref:NAD(P)-binding protein n=1 Tax=Polyplosphaeria fusca TaxID=682080 RepID=A0A9P4V1I5_9PLEO|nr:NAD(P)-binding protein [Polyplosphaeria fusca]